MADEFSDFDIFKFLRGSGSSNKTLNDSKTISQWNLTSNSSYKSFNFLRGDFLYTENTTFIKHKLFEIYPPIITSVSVLGIIGNLMVLLAYLRKYKQITPFKFLIIHLGGSDLLFSVALLLQVAGYGWFNDTNSWLYGIGLCKLTRTALLLGSITAVGTILAIAIERFSAIKQGLLSMTRRNLWLKTILGIVFIWVFAMCSCAPIFMSSRLINQTCQLEDEFGHEWSKVYSIYMLTFSCVIPMIAIAIMYGIVIYKICRSTRLYKHMLNETVRKRKRQDSRRIRIIITIITFFFICVLPIRVMWVLNEFGKMEGPEWLVFEYYCGFLPYAVHAAVNPLIYSIYSKKFRRELLRMTLCYSRKETEDDTLILSNNCSRRRSKIVYFMLSVRVRQGEKLEEIQIKKQENPLLSKQDTEIIWDTRYCDKVTCV